MVKNFAQSLADARLMADAIKAHIEELKGSTGMAEDTGEKLSALVKEMSDLDTAQEKLKADLKQKTAELDTKAKELDALMTDCKKRVKLGGSKDGWKEYGITATR